MIPVRFHAEARAEPLEAATYYDAQQKALGRRFTEAVREAVHRIQDWPRLYKVIERDIHRCRVPPFPYGLIYRLREDEVQIIAVMHLHRRPGYWRSRTQSD